MTQPRRLALAAALATALALAVPPAFSQAPAKPQAHETSIDGVTAEILEASRKEGVLTLKVRYRNNSDTAAAFPLYRNWDDKDYYVTAGSTKMLVLKDSKGAGIATPHGAHGETQVDIKPRGSFLFWAKYPAPPEATKKVSFFHPHSPPIEDIPITDSK
ncbi:MAG TPA: hypothetical protein VM073_09255 [Usitatibacter sp.]|nr:hypothetical protein [Usitatibacter sp.]